MSITFKHINIPEVESNLNVDVLLSFVSVARYKEIALHLFAIKVHRRLRRALSDSVRTKPQQHDTYQADCHTITAPTAVRDDNICK